LVFEWIVLALAIWMLALVARPTLVQDTVLWLAATGISAVAAVFVLFLLYVVLAPARIASDDEYRYLALQAEVESKLKPFQVAEAVNRLRLDLRQLGQDAYLPEGAMSKIIWDDRCLTFLKECEVLVAQQRNKYVVPLYDAIHLRVTQDELVIGKNTSTMKVLNRVDDVLELIEAEIGYD